MKHKPSKVKSGHSLIEVLFAFALFGIGIPSVVGLSTLAARMGDAARTRMTAVHAARTQMEELMQLSFHDAALDPDTYSVQVGPYAGWVIVQDRVAGETKDLLVRIEYSTHAGPRLIELEGVISYALH
jgi:Tfp pilus assembly protein PilV